MGALIAEKFAAEGSNIAINYVSSDSRAKETASKIESEYKVKTLIVQGDVGVQADCIKIVKAAVEGLGGLDVVVANAAWTKFCAFENLHGLEEEDWDKCWATNVKGNFHLFREAVPTFNTNAEGGAFIVTSAVAAISKSGSSLAYAVSKAAGLHLVKCLAQSTTEKVRVNAVLPGLLLTEWGNKFPAEQIEAHRQSLPLKRTVDLDDCANLFVNIAQNNSLTGQGFQIDCGYKIK